MERIDDLWREITQLETALADLKSQLALAETEAREQTQTHPAAKSSWPWPLQQEEYDRYSRQMIIPGFGAQSQLRIRESKVLIIGAGGLGCPAAAYLAGAGIGTIGLVDGDVVEKSNLHRQIAHSTSRIGWSKVKSAVAYLKELNPTIVYKAHQTHLTPQNAESIVSRYDIVLDCTDHPTSRYLTSDICVLLGKPLISASAFQTSGQLTVLNNPPGEGPCYRCIWPRPPLPDSVVGCGEGGILGPVVGVMGVLQALQCLKLIARDQGQGSIGSTSQATMLIFSALDSTPFRSVRLRGKRADCFACSSSDGLTVAAMQSSMDYVQFCGVPKPVALFNDAERMLVDELDHVLRADANFVVVDVREKEHFEMCNLKGSINLPISTFTRTKDEEFAAKLEKMPELRKPIFVVCRVGNDSQIATAKLHELGYKSALDVKGGLRAWKEAIDPSFPFV